MGEAIQMKRYLLTAIVFILMASQDQHTASAQSEPVAAEQATYYQPKINIVNGVVDPESVIKIYDEIDYQRAVQLYHWAIPIVGTHGWERANRIGNIGSYDIGSYAGYDNVAGIMTPNQVVDYLIAFPVLDKPVVLENPEGFSAGMVMDYWQNTIQQIGSVGPNQGKREKILLIGPGVETPENTEGYDVVHIPTRVAFLGTRNMITDQKDHERFNLEMRLYPYGNEDKAGSVKPVLAKDTESGLAYLQRQPHGMEYWDALDEIIQREVVLERNIIFLDMLEKLGIKKGDVFNPTEKQKQRFIAAEYQANINASVNSYSTRLKGKKFWKDSNWLLPLAIDPSNQHHDLDGKAAWYWEAISSSPAMVTKTVGVGSTYLGLYMDENGHGFDGGKRYQFVVPAKIPARQFWTVTLYDNSTRSLLLNDSKNAELGSLSDLVYNSDGTATFTFSPTKGNSKNWIQTNPGENWFTWFRLYQPEQEYFDKTFFLPNITLDTGGQ